MSDTRKYYEAYDDRYKQVHNESLQWFSEQNSEIVSEVISEFQIQKSMKILEVGCGEGRDAKYLMTQGYNVLATDISEEAISYCKKSYPLGEACFQTLDCINEKLEERFDFIYAVAVVHMLVLDEDRNAFYKFVNTHLKESGIALICTMGDGEIERQSDISTAFELQERIHEESGKTLMLAGTSCRMVNFETFGRELASNGFEIIKQGITSIETVFTHMMYAVVRRKKIMEYNIDILVAGCNTTCMHCYVNGGKGPIMSFEDFQYCIEKLQPVFNQYGKNISFTLDNELYNHPNTKEILEFVEGSVAENYFHHGSTTGIAILEHPNQKEILRILKRNNWCEVSFAIHGNEETHNKIVNHPNAMESIIKAAKLFKENGFKIWISLMISKEFVKDLQGVSEILNQIPYDSLEPVISLFYPTRRLIKYQDIRCNVDEYRKVLEFLKEKNVNTERIERAMCLYNEDFVSKYVKEDEIAEMLTSNEMVYFHIDHKLNFYLGNTGSALRCYGNLRDYSSEEIIRWISEAEDNYYETSKIHYAEVINAVKNHELKKSKENYVYPDEISCILAMIQNKLGE